MAHTPSVVCDTAKVRFFKQITTHFGRRSREVALFAILQKYDFSSKSQLNNKIENELRSCLRYCKSTIFQANHNFCAICKPLSMVVCDTAKVRFFKQITTEITIKIATFQLFAILQKYDFSSKSQPSARLSSNLNVVCDTAKVRFFKQITTGTCDGQGDGRLFAILQKYDFSSKSQRAFLSIGWALSCLRYCKSTIFQANHNGCPKVWCRFQLFAILQKYDFSSKSQPKQACTAWKCVVCDTAKVRFFKQITTVPRLTRIIQELFAILQKYDFSSKSQQTIRRQVAIRSCLRYCKSTIFQANHNYCQHVV